MRALLRLALLSAVALAPAVAGCAVEAADEAESDDQAVSSTNLAGMTFDEVGRFHQQGRIAGVTAEDRTVPSLRFNAFGDTKVRVEITGPGAPVGVLVGPLPSEDRTVVFSKRGRSGKNVIETTLPKPGAYRLLVGATANFSGSSRARTTRGSYDVAFECLASCTPRQMSLDAMFQGLKSSVGEAALGQGIDQLVDALVPDADMRASFKEQLRGVLASESLGTAPMVSMAAIGAAQGLFEQAPRNGTSPNDNGRKDVDLDTAGADCHAPREAPAPLSPSLPGVTRGHAPDYAVDDCMLARLRGLTDALNALSMENGSIVTMSGRTLSTPGEVAAALLDSGHTIRVENARFIADFLGLNYQGVSVMAPVWVDTGIALPTGGTLRVPSPHAHHNLWIDGPRFRGQLKFYMGVPAGIRFRVQDTITPEWDGGPTLSGRVLYAFDGESERDAVVETFDAAGALRKKWTLEGEGRPMDGYGQLGVCTDSVAVLEHQRTGQATLFPLLHPKPREVRDDIDRTLAALPSDGAGFDPADALRRISLSLPTEPADSPFEAYASGMRALGR